MAVAIEQGPNTKSPELLAEAPSPAMGNSKKSAGFENKNTQVNKQISAKNRDEQETQNLFEPNPGDSPNAADIEGDELVRELENKALSDKEIETRNISILGSIQNDHEFFKLIDKVATWASRFTLVTNLFGAVTSLLPVAQSIKDKSEKIVTRITQASFVPFSISAVKNGFKKRNPWQMLGFALEGIMPWLGNLKDIYLLRGISTGLDQCWVATEKKLADKYKDNTFPRFRVGLREVPKAMWEQLKEVAKDPMGTLFTTKPQGHLITISTIGDVVATLGYLLTGKEKIFGTLRDIAAPMFDWEMLLSDKVDQRISGALFILEAGFDFAARFLSGNKRMFVNQLSHASGRYALELYKDSDSASNADKPIANFEEISKRMKIAA